MTKINFIGVILLSLFNVSRPAIAVENSTKNDDRTQILNILNKYEAALNESSTGKVIPLYATDGLFMPTEAPTAKGTEQLKGAYDHVFGTIKLAIKFSIDEIVVDGSYAYAVTGSKGKVTILASGKQQPEENRELFVFRKEKSGWRIARYMFNKAARSE